MNKAISPVLALVVLALIGAGLMLGGFFDDAGGVEIVDDAGPAVSENPAAKTPTRSPTPPVVGVPTSRFTAANDKAGAVERLDGQETGLVANGVVVDPSGAPVPDARVALIHDVSQVKTRPQDGETLLELVTTADGRFSFENLEVQEVYVIRASHQAFTTVRVHPIDPAVPGSLTQTIKLERGVGLSGSVVGSDGLPVNEAEIVVYDLNVSSLDPRMTPERTGFSTLNGTYTVEHLRPGLKRIMARKPGYSTEGRNGFNLGEGEGATGLNFVLGKGFTIRGIVTDRTSSQPIDAALVNARVVSMLPTQHNRPAADSGGEVRPGEPDHQRGAINNRRPFNNNLGASRAFHVETVATNPDGRFELSGLLEARYVISVTAPGYQIANGKPANAGDDGVSIVMAPSPRIMGRVVDDQTGEPVSVFTIATTAVPNPAFVPRRSRQRFEDEEGRFAYVDVRPGTHYLIASSEGYAGGQSEPITVAVEEERTGIEIRLVRGAILRGSVTDRRGTPIQGASVSLDQPVQPGSDPAGEMFRRLISQQMRKTGMRSAITDAKGAWKIDNVLGGSYSLKVEHADYTDVESPPLKCGDRGEVVAPTVVLSQGGIIRGTVSKEDGTPDGKATVMVSSDDPRIPFNKSIVTGPEGSFEVKGLKPGTYRVLVAQRDGQFDLLKILQSRNDPGSLVTVGEGEVSEVQR